MAAANRVVYEYTLPPSLDCEIKTIGIVELTVDEELMATKRARGDNFRLAWELARQCVAFVDGKPVSTADDTSDIAWAKLSPKARQLVLGAYSDLHQPIEAELGVFKASRKVKAG